MSKKYFVIIAMIALAAVSGGAIAQDAAGNDNDRGDGQRQHRGPHRGFGDPVTLIERMASHLDLDEAQKQSIADIMEASRAELEALRDSSRANQEAIHALDVSDPEYDMKLQDLSARSGELAAERTLLTGRIRGQVAAVLNDEQRQALEDRMSGKGERRRHFRPDHSR
jgi:Spy/CpxP family protein refolding chaperone